MFELKFLVGKDKMARVQKVKSGVITYITDDGFAFEVTSQDMGDTEFPGECKAISLMKYIKRALIALDSKDENNE